MNDLSPVIPWLAGALVCLLVAVLGWRQGRQGDSSWPGAVFIALGLGVLSIFLASGLHTVCVESLHWCRSRGDGNITYALAPLLGLPLYVFLIVVARLAGRVPAATPPDPHPAAILQSLLQHKNGQAVTVTCPSCEDIIGVQSERIGSQPVSLYTRCGCGRCNERFRLQP